MNAPQRKILLVDLDAFFVSVEELLDPTLRDKPVVVGGNPQQRGVVAAASYAARRFGVHSALPMRTALERCPHLIVVPPHRQEYSRYSHRVMDLLREYSELVEPVSIDEAYLELPVDVPFYRAGAVGQEVQRRIRDEIDLPCSVGVATGKLVAKIACERSKPQGFLAVAPGREASFLAPLSVGEMPGIGPRTEAALRAQGLETLGQLADASEAMLAKLFGRRGLEMRLRARGVDPSPVASEHEARSRSVENTFSRDLDKLPDLLKRVEEMSREVADQLKKEGLMARTVGLKLRYSDFTTITRAFTRRSSTDDAQAIYRDVAALLQAAWEPGRPVRLLGVKAERFVSPQPAPGGPPRLL